VRCDVCLEDEMGKALGRTAERSRVVHLQAQYAGQACTQAKMSPHYHPQGHSMHLSGLPVRRRHAIRCASAADSDASPPQTWSNGWCILKGDTLEVLHEF
jgi:hypothetical protein